MVNVERGTYAPYYGETPVKAGEIWQEQDTVEITLTAKWSKATRVVFDSDGGTECAGITLYDGEEIPALPQPTKPVPAAMLLPAKTCLCRLWTRVASTLFLQQRVAGHLGRLRYAQKV